MVTLSWQLQTPLDAIIFDCDGTLSTIEGIDELAKLSHTHEQVKQLTAEAMGKTGLNLALYQQRLNLVQPTEKHVLALGQLYFAHVVNHAKAVIQICKRLNKSVYIISAGLHPAVTAFGEQLTVARENIFAVDIHFDHQGNFLNFDQASPLTGAQGKREIVHHLKKLHSRMAYVGDGLNDLPVIDQVTRFIGYGGSFYREIIAKHCQYYINVASLSPLLPLILTHEEATKLTSVEQSLYQEGLDAITNKQVKHD